MKNRFLIVAIAILTMLWGCGCDNPPPNVPQEIADTFDDDGYYPDINQQPLNEQVNGNDFLTEMLFGGAARTDPRLPNYSYCQALLQAEEHIIVAGQVRVIGGLVGADSGVVSLYSGAMITANPYAYTGSGAGLTVANGGNGVKTRVGEWREIPTP